jgi:hypothetical protein
LEPRSASLVDNLASYRLASGSRVCTRLELEGADRSNDVCLASGSVVLILGWMYELIRYRDP